ncbi:creatininase family protein, partial [Escherichia coli]|nr:creatininase family protein [Escherichia coli]
PVGYSIEHMDVGGTKTLAFDAAVRRWIDIGRQVAGRGQSKLVILNAHGGNAPLMTIVATELRVHCNMLAVATSWTRFGLP